MFNPDDVIDEKYVVVRSIGSGGMGAVYEARHLVMERSVAVKVLHAWSAEREEGVARFTNEARAAAIIGSDHIVEIFDAGMLEGRVPYLVMELLVGADLQEIFESRGVLDEEYAVDLIVQACEGLAAAHQNQIIHRDLKPSNIFITSSDGAGEWVKIVDFGIAKFKDLSQTGGARLTADGATLGTPRYMAPEQLGSAEKVDHRADIYALGLILYEAVTATVPFGGASIVQMLARAAKEMPAPPRSIRPDLREELEAVILKAIAPEPADRFSSMEAFAQALMQSVGSYSMTAGFNDGRASSGQATPAMLMTLGSVETVSAESASAQLPPSPQVSTPAHVSPSSFVPAPPPRSRTKLIVVLVAMIAGLFGVIVAAGVALVAFGLWTPISSSAGGTQVQPVTPPPSQPVPSAMPTPPRTPQPVQPIAKQASPPPFSPEVLMPHETMVDPSVINASQSPALGPTDAKVIIYEFTDYQCAPCNRAHAVAKATWEAHRDEVHMVVFNFPIDIACNPRVPVPAHRMACQAASVAVCAEEQGRFWEMADELHGLSGALDPLRIRGAATKAGLDLARLDQCMVGDRPRQRILHDIDQASRLSINATPIFVINGRMVPGNPGSRLEAMIQYLLEHEGRWPQTAQSASTTP